MRILFYIIISFYFFYSKSVASNYSNILGEKKNKAVTHYKCKIQESYKKKEKNAEFGIIVGEGIDDYHYVISYSKDKKKYSYPYSYAKYFKRKIDGRGYDIKVFVSLGTPEYRYDLGPSIALHLAIYSFVTGDDQALITYWFNARDYKTNDKYLFQEWEDLVKNETQNLDKKLRLFTDKVFNILANKMKVNSVGEIVDIVVGQFDASKYGIYDYATQECKVKYQKITTRKKAFDKKSNDEDLLIADQKKKIEEEKRKIEEEKKKIAEAKKKQDEEDKKRKEADEKLYVIGSGTGFFVSKEGHVISNNHVVGICRKVVSKINGDNKFFKVLKTDEVNDLGLIKSDYINPDFLSIKSSGAEYGEDIVAFGYPLADALSTSVKLTRGIVSSLSGPGNNYSEIQIDAAIQPGNSGGPVLNMEGQVVGVASSGLNKIYMLEKAEYIPENVNFAVASPTLTNFLKANGIPISNKSYDIQNTKELAKIGRPSTLQLFCMNTKSVFEELKKKKKHSDVLFEKVIEFK